MSNRVEELESQVAELQAAVDGLTEELVETRERLRQLETADGVDNSRTPQRRESAVTADVGTEVEHADESGTEAEETDAEADSDTTEEVEAEDDEGDSDGSDIIVA